MNPTRATVLAALVAALGLTAFGSAYAAGPADQGRPGERPGFTERDTQRGGPRLEFRRDGMGAFRLAEVSCAPQAAERLEARLDRVTGRLDLTGDQQKLFDEFRTSALTAQTGFADSCKTLAPAAAAETDADLVQRLEQRLKFDEARLAAMTELLPHFKSFYESLTDAQKSELMPVRSHQGMNKARVSSITMKASPPKPAVCNPAPSGG